MRLFSSEDCTYFFKAKSIKFLLSQCLSFRITVIKYCSLELEKVYILFKKKLFELVLITLSGF